MDKEEQNYKEYETTDLSLAAFLLVKNCQIYNTRKKNENGKRLIFVLRGMSEGEEGSLVKDFYTGRALVDPLAYAGKFRQLKSLIHDGEPLMRNK